MSRPLSTFAGRVPDPALHPPRGEPARPEEVSGFLALEIVPHPFVDGAERADEGIEVGLAKDPELAVVDRDRGHRARGAGDEGAPAEDVAALDHDPRGERVRGCEQGHLPGLHDVEAVGRPAVVEDRVAALAAHAEEAVGDRAKVRRREAAEDGEAADAVRDAHELVAAALDGDRVGDDARAEPGRRALAPARDLLGSETLTLLEVLGNRVAVHELEGGGGEGGRIPEHPVERLAGQHPDVGFLARERVVGMR